MSTSARAILALVKIMDNKKVVLRRRIEACESLLAFEAPDEIVDKAKSFLAAVFEDNEHVGIDDRLMAAKLMRKASAARVTQQTVKSTDGDRNKEIFRQIEIAGRRARLIANGMWLAPSSWADDLLSDDYLPPTDLTFDQAFNG